MSEESIRWPIRPHGNRFGEGLKGGMCEVDGVEGQEEGNFDSINSGISGEWKGGEGRDEEGGCRGCFMCV